MPFESFKPRRICLAATNWYASFKNSLTKHYNELLGLKFWLQSKKACVFLEEKLKIIIFIKNSKKLFWKIAVEFSVHSSGGWRDVQIKLL